jgi:hypothetical protein
MMKKVKNIIQFEVGGKTYGIDLNQKCWIGASGKPISRKPAHANTVFNLFIQCTTYDQHPLLRFIANRISCGYSLDDLFNVYGNTLQVLDRLESLQLNKPYSLSEMCAPWVLKNFAKILKSHSNDEVLDFRRYYKEETKKEWIIQHHLHNTPVEYQNFLHFYFAEDRFSRHISKINWYIQKNKLFDISQSYERYDQNRRHIHVVERGIGVIAQMVNFANDLGIDLPKGDLYPTYLQLFETHALYKQNLNNQQIVKNQSNRNLFFQDEKYMVVIPQTAEEFKDEAEQQSNCVYRCYLDKVINDQCNIVFIREKDAPEKSLVTCEINSCGVIALFLAKHNRHPSDELLEFEKKYQEHLDNHFTK